MPDEVITSLDQVTPEWLDGRSHAQWRAGYGDGHGFQCGHTSTKAISKH